MNVEICAPAEKGAASAPPAAPRTGAGGGIAVIVVVCWRVDVLKLNYSLNKRRDLVALRWLRSFSIRSRCVCESV
jgi:hypothetical protein